MKSIFLLSCILVFSPFALTKGKNSTGSIDFKVLGKSESSASYGKFSIKHPNEGRVLFGSHNYPLISYEANYLVTPGGVGPCSMATNFCKSQGFDEAEVVEMRDIYTSKYGFIDSTGQVVKFQRPPPAWTTLKAKEFVQINCYRNGLSPDAIPYCVSYIDPFVDRPEKVCEIDIGDEEIILATHLKATDASEILDGETATGTIFKTKSCSQGGVNYVVVTEEPIGNSIPGNKKVSYVLVVSK